MVVGILRHSMDAVTDEMLLTIVRTAHTSIIRDALDVSVAICSPDGQMVAQGFCIPFHLGAIPDGMEAVIEKFGDTVVDGDVFILNDPYTGGMHLPDLFLFKPVFIEERLLAYLVIVGDYGDVGGRVAGGRPHDAESVFEEGLRIPPLRYIEAGRPVSAIREIIGQNVRFPTHTLSDLDSCLAAFRSAESLLNDTVARFGVRTLEAYFDQILDYSEALTRATIRDLPDGDYEFTDWMDDRVVSDDPVTIHCRLQKTGTELLFDFSGSSEQVNASLNCTMSWTRSATYAAVRTLLPPDLPNNSGMFRAITVRAPLGSILNPREPAPVAERGATGFRIVDCILGLLAKMVPDRIPAAGEGGASALRMAGENPDGSRFLIGDSVMGTWGGRPDRDGIDGCANFAANATNHPIEVLESELPVRILRYGFRTDSAGPGRYRGGAGIEREWELLADRATVSIRNERARFPAWGLAGGKPGSLAETILNPQSQAMVLRGKTRLALHRGDRILLQQASGGGFGDPFSRDPPSALKDWRNGLVSGEHARRAYGVAINEQDGLIDWEETARLRSGRPPEADDPSALNV